MNSLAKQIAERISAGLARKSAVRCSKWAELYRVMGSGAYPGPWSFKKHSWLKGMHDSDAELNIGMKAAQLGYSEAMLNRAFFQLDIRKTDVLYVLPSSNPDASDFSAGRFTPAMELSPHIRSMFSDSNSVGFKRAGTSSLYIRGSRSRAQLKSIPVGLVICDEVDEMTQENLPMVLERMSGQATKSAWMISTPTIPGVGIRSRFEQSSQNRYFFPCPSCRRMIDLTFENLVISGEDLDDPGLKESHLVCQHCKAILPHDTKSEWLVDAEWVEAYPDRDTKGWSVNQLYSTTVSPAEIAKSYIIGLTDKAALMEFHNQKLGSPYLIEGSKLTDVEVDACRGDYANGSQSFNGLVTMGVDVGTVLHYAIVGWHIPDYASGIDINLYSHARVLKFGKVRNFEDLDDLMRLWGVDFSVIDAQPERRKSLEYANRFFGKILCNYYSHSANNRSCTINESERSITADRTLWLDLTLGRVRRGQPWITLPNDIDIEFKSHLKALIRDTRTDQWGRPIGRYVCEDRSADHYAHAMNYAEIALPQAAALGRAVDLTHHVV